jgi:eukaryotic-like serine/threonine-protein kinase
VTFSRGARLGPYEVSTPLGAGGMGEVWRARDTRLGRDVAIKVLPADLASDAGRLKRFEKEARSASALNHPNIVTIFDIGSSDSVSYISMELVEGKTLRELLFSGSLPIKRVLAIATQVADGLARAHEAGIVHRDLKPENVMVTKDGRVKVLDFGLAKLTHSMESGGGTNLPTETGTDAGIVMGTVGYMSPEQASGHPVDFRSDQFSFGSILYELLTGRRAFHKKTGAQTLTAIIEQEPEPIAAFNPQTPAPLRWIVERCLAKEAEERYGTTRDLARELQTIQRHLSEAEPKARTPVRPGGRRLAFAMVVAFLVIAAAIAWLLARRSGTVASGTPPRIAQVTFGRQNVITARFAPDGETIVYGATMGDSPQQLFQARPGSPESRPLGMKDATIASISSFGEMAILLGPNYQRGTLAVASLGGGAPREILENVRRASWSADGKSLAVVHSMDGKDRLEFPIGKVIYQSEAGSQAPSGASIVGCAVAPAGDRIAFADFKNLSVVDLDGKVTRVADLRVGSDFVWSPRGDELWFTDYSKGNTELYATTLLGRKRLLASLPGDFVLMDVSSRGRILLERADVEIRIVGRLAGDEKEHDIEWLEGTLVTDISRDGRTLLLDESRPGYSVANSVYLRRAGGSSPVRLGAGWGQALSPDGRWVVTRPDLGRPPIILTPSGPGLPRSLPSGGLAMIGWSNWLPDGKRIIFSANAPGRKSRLYVQDISGGDPRPVSPAGYVVGRGVNFVSPDGNLAVARDDQMRAVLIPVEGEANGAPRLIAGLRAGEEPVQWSTDGRLLFVKESQWSSRIVLLDPISGERKLWREFDSPPPSFRLQRFIVTPDGKAWARNYLRFTSNLFFLENVS